MSRLTTHIRKGQIKTGNLYPTGYGYSEVKVYEAPQGAKITILAGLGSRLLLEEQIRIGYFYDISKADTLFLQYHKECDIIYEFR